MPGKNEDGLSRRFMDVNYREAGRKMVLDRATDRLIPQGPASTGSAVCRMDCASCGLQKPSKDEVVRSPVGAVILVPRRCGKCGHVWETEANKNEPCPSCGYKQVVHGYQVGEMFVTLDVAQKADAELERTKELLKSIRAPGGAKLTVGDISLATCKKNDPKIVRQRLRAMAQSLTVGNMSEVTAERDSVDAELQREQARARGLTVGDLSVAKKHIPEPSMSPSQEIAADMIRKHNDERRKVSEMKERVFDLQNGARNFATSGALGEKASEEIERTERLLDPQPEKAPPAVGDLFGRKHGDLEREIEERRKNRAAQGKSADPPLLNLYGKKHGEP
jgi:hypothetical protein